ncbi:hypothetical protein, partial [Phascolarctobacterium succinatutens]
LGVKAPIPQIVVANSAPTHNFFKFTILPSFFLICYTADILDVLYNIYRQLARILSLFCRNEIN